MYIVYTSQLYFKKHNKKRDKPMESRPVLHVVTTNLKKLAFSNPDKSMADVILEGTYTRRDIISVLDSSAFPTNSAGQSSPEERHYNANEAAEEFARSLAVHLSDLDLHKFTEMAVQCELLKDTEAFRNATIAKALLKIQRERHPDDGETVLLNVSRSHLKFVLKTMEKNWAKELGNNVNSFLAFNLGYPQRNDNLYLDEINQFDNGDFNLRINMILSDEIPDPAAKTAFIKLYSKNPRIHLPQISYHPALASPDSALQNPDQIYSDHLPILTTMNVDNGQLLNIISWNVFDHTQADGFKKPNVRLLSQPDQTPRYERVTDAIVAMFKSENANINPDVMLLQELHPDCLAILQRKLLGSGIQIKQSEQMGKITLFNSEKFKFLLTKEYFREDCFSLRLDTGRSVVSINNVHRGYNASPLDAEQSLKKIMAAETEASAVLIMGDFNSCIKPLDNDPRLIMTCLSPSNFRTDAQDREICQGVDWTDGAFRRNREGKLTQMEYHIINPATCELFDKLATPFLPSMNNNQKNELSAMRMAICVDSPFNEYRVFPRKRTIVDVENELRLKTGDNNLLVRIGSNTLNEEALCILSGNVNFINTVTAYLNGTRAAEKQLNEQWVVSVGSAWAVNLECALLAATDQIPDKLTTALASIKAAPGLGFFESDPNLKMAQILLKVLSNSNEPGVDILIVAAIMSSKNEKLKTALSNEFGIEKHRDLDTAFGMMLSNITLFDGSVLVKKEELIKYIDLNNLSEIENTLKSYHLLARQEM
jgi:transcriptional regulator of met regulon